MTDNGLMPHQQYFSHIKATFLFKYLMNMRLYNGHMSIVDIIPQIFCPRLNLY